MPRCVFDVRDGDRQDRDPRGLDVADVSRVWEIAVPLVGEIAWAEAHLHPPHGIAVAGRDAEGAVVHRRDHVRGEAPAA